MEYFNSSDLKTILHSKRANIYFLEHCRILVRGGTVHYVTSEGKESLYHNIPIANTTTVFLGTGTSITQKAVQYFAKAGVMLGFCGGGGTPLYSANEYDFDVLWFSPQSEYRPTEYLQKWVQFWFSEERRLNAAKILQKSRIDCIKKAWIEKNFFAEMNFSEKNLDKILSVHEKDIEKATDIQSLLTAEGRATSGLYKLCSESLKYGEFRRSKYGSGQDLANKFLDFGNYLAYGIGATATWVLGLPHGLSVLHGKTRRGGLVFDAADVIKDALILPQSFISAQKGEEENEFRESCIYNLVRFEALDCVIDTLKKIAEELDR
jgi:CRISPR-associated protein Cas1